MEVIQHIYDSTLSHFFQNETFGMLQEQETLCFGYTDIGLMYNSK